MASPRLYELYGRLICVPLVTADGVLRMLTLQMQPVSTTTLMVRHC